MTLDHEFLNYKASQNCAGKACWCQILK